MNEHVKPPNPQRRSARARQAILAAAAELLGEVGYTRLAIEAIAARAGVGKQTIYRWWPDKGAVVLDAYLALVGAEGELTMPTTEDLAADLAQVLAAAVAMLADPAMEARYRALLTAIQDDPALAATLRERLVLPWLEATTNRLRAAEQAGQLRPGLDLPVVVELFYGAMYYRWLLRTGPLSPDYAATIVSLLMQAITAAPPSPRD